MKESSTGLAGVFASGDTSSSADEEAASMMWDLEETPSDKK